MNANSGEVFRNLLVCPLCKGRLNYNIRQIECSCCAQKYPQRREDCWDLLPRHLLRRGPIDWERRQLEMEQWYDDLISIPVRASSCLANDYDPYASILKTYTGLVLDVGGGAGIPRHYLPTDVHYVVVDPSLDWLGSGWTSIAPHFPCLQTRPSFVRGIGEYLPFADRSFDSSLAFWSLNHADEPKRVVHEVGRVLKPGGRFLAVLEDMEPTWTDLFDKSLRTLGKRHLGRTLIKKLQFLFLRRPWPLQRDHIRIRESDLRSWSAPCLEKTWRGWIGNFLTLEFRKIGPTAKSEQADTPW